MPFLAPIISNYVSPMPFGRFQATLNPNNNRIEIQVRVNWMFQNTSAVVTDPIWSAQSIAVYKNALAQNVAATWNRKWKLRCNAAGYQGVYEPYFTLIDGSADNKHFDIMIDNKQGGSGLWLDGRLQLFKYDVMMYDDIPGTSKSGMGRGGVYESEMKKLRPLVQNIANIKMIRGIGGGAAGTWTVDPADQIKITQFAHGLANLGDLATHIPITIHATSGAKGKAAAVVNALVTAITANGINPALYTFDTDATKTWAKWVRPCTAHKTDALVTVDMREDLMPILNAWRYEYRVGDHEFGHCIGLPDEYMIYRPGSGLAPAHAAWVALCTTAGVLPNPFPAAEDKSVYNRSLMTAGWVTCACHYVTIWDAVRRMTNVPPYNVAPGDWVIERGTEGGTI